MIKGPQGATRRIKMTDIARIAGVSASTVSRALSGNTMIPAQLREQISTLAKEHGYVVNESARSLRLQRTNTISIIVPLGHESSQLISDPFFLEMIGRLADEITGRGYEILLHKITTPTPGWLDRIIQSHRSDGLLIIGQSDQHEALNLAADSYLPIVVWGGLLADQRYCTVGSDNVQGGRLATEHLIGLGRRRIAFLGAPEAPEVELRRRGYTEALKTAGLEISPDLMAPAHFTVETAHDTVRKLIDSGVRFDGVFAASDLIAMTAIEAFSAAGLKTPDDISIVGFDDIAIARLGVPPLTTVRQDLASGARQMVDRLFQRIDGEAAMSIFMAPELVVRQS